MSSSYPQGVWAVSSNSDLEMRLFIVHFTPFMLIASPVTFVAKIYFRDKRIPFSKATRFAWKMILESDGWNRVEIAFISPFWHPIVSPEENAFEPLLMNSNSHPCKLSLLKTKIPTLTISWTCQKRLDSLNVFFKWVLLILVTLFINNWILGLVSECES